MAFADLEKGNSKSAPSYEQETICELSLRSFVEAFRHKVQRESRTHLLAIHSQFHLTSFQRYVERRGLLARDLQSKARAKRPCPLERKLDGIYSLTFSLLKSITSHIICMEMASNILFSPSKGPRTPEALIRGKRSANLRGARSGSPQQRT